MTAVRTAQAPKQTRLKNVVRRGVILTMTLLILAFGASVWQVIRVPAWPQDSSLIVNDVSRLNPIRVSGIVVPTTTEEIVSAVQDHPGPVAIGGARHSMGGQVATESALHIDMRHFDQILEFSPANKTDVSIRHSLPDSGSAGEFGRSSNRAVRPLVGPGL